MTDLQKRQIVVMRQQNTTYTTISAALGIPVSTIKTFCRRNGMMAEASTRKPVCKNCGVGLTNMPGARHRLFCSDRCKQTWWNKHRWERVSTKLVPHICATCGRSFTDYSGANRKYCSRKCYRERSAHDGQQGI